MTATRLVTTLCLVLLLCLGTSGSALAAFGVEFLAPDQGAVQEIGFFHSFHNTITNTGDEADVFVVSMVKNIPGTWVGSICIGETCYPPFITEVEVPLGAGETAFLDIDITPMDPTYGSCDVTVSSLGDPSQRPMYTFTVVSTGLDLLLVTDDTTPTLETYYTSALAGTGKTMGVWKQVEMGPLSNLELAEFGTVVWSAGNLAGSLDDDDRAALAYFVQHGGNLFLSGRDLAYEACDPGSPYYSANTLSWFNTILGTGYTGDVASSFAQAQGVAGDPITSDLSFGLSGGDGADNTHLTLDGVTPVTPGLTTLRYFDGSVGEDAAIRSSYGEGKTYFCAFAFEAIADATSRTTLMERVVLWFDGLLTPVEGDLVTPLLTRAPFASPNPFNPQTSIKFSVGGSAEVPAEISVYDLRGQLVRRLFKGTVAPGAQDFVWNGRDDQGQNLATGVYLAQIKLAGAQAQTVKMTLAK